MKKKIGTSDTIKIYCARCINGSPGREWLNNVDMQNIEADIG